MAMSAQQGKGQVYSLSGGTIVLKDLAGVAIVGYVSPNLQSLRVTHNGKLDEIKGQDGEYNAFIASGEKVECEFSFIPQGSTIANAKVSAQFPPLGSAGAISGLPVIACGSFSDVFNTGVWYYQGGGSDNGVNDSNWTGTITLVRYPGITTTAAIAA